MKKGPKVFINGQWWKSLKDGDKVYPYYEEQSEFNDNCLKSLTKKIKNNCIKSK